MRFCVWNCACISSVICCIKYKVAGHTFDSGCRWPLGEEENENLGVHGNVAKDSSERLDFGWTFSWNECAVSDKEGTFVKLWSSHFSSEDEIWSEVVWTREEDTWGEGGNPSIVKNLVHQMKN